MISIIKYQAILRLQLIKIIALFISVTASLFCFAIEADSVYLFSYATTKNEGRNGLHFAWSPDKQSWQLIGEEYGFLKSDYGRWGKDKKIFSPYLIQTSNGDWHCVWSVNEHDANFGHVASTDLIYWGRQLYPAGQKGSNFLQPTIHFDAVNGQYVIQFKNSVNQVFQMITKDFKSYSPVIEIPLDKYVDTRVKIELPNGTATGQIHKVAQELVKRLINTFNEKQRLNSLYAETTSQDKARFANLQPLEAELTIQPQKAKPISNILLGVFFEDINYAADGGLYAELIQNRDFEYNLADKEYRDKNWNSTHSWNFRGSGTQFSIDSSNPIHPNNAHYLVLNTKYPGATLENMGFDGIALKKGDTYNFSIFAKLANAKASQLQVRLVSLTKGEIAKTTLIINSGNWKSLKAKLTASENTDDAYLELQPQSRGILMLDMISLFPQNTFKDRKNGLRKDLATTISNIQPKFIRFPGGCVAHGDGLANIYRWKNTIGPLEARKPQRNLWGYHQTAGLGFYEYFQFCEDIGAAPLPVVAAGVPCQNSDTDGPGQQGGIPLNEMDDYIQDIVDLVEWANGDIHSKWGKKRAEAGHPQPFNLRYIGVGNEDLISDVFEERFTLIYQALQKTHPEITVIGTVGPWFEGTDYVEGWKIADKLQIPMVDEHYYQPPGWFIHNQGFYDSYDRSKSKVYLGEYASHLPGRPNNLETALSEALYLTAIERNGDIVNLASYAPLLARDGHTQWNPNLIYFNNSEVKPTVGYYVQQLYGQNAGNEYLPGLLSLSNDQEAVKKRIGFSVVRDTKTNDIILKMVNMLPVPVKCKFNASDLSLLYRYAVKTVLRGNPDQRDVQPVTTTQRVGINYFENLPPYSFTVLRMKTRAKY